MGPQKNRRTDRQRLPLTITLDPATYSFVEECARLKQFRSIDEFFEAALTNFRQHVRALDAYLELEAAKGKTLEEILSSTQCEIVFTRPANKFHKRGKEIT
jgi:archaeosine-15-forming tRNA-guanine transglycosylase